MPFVCLVRAVSKPASFMSARSLSSNKGNHTKQGTSVGALTCLGTCLLHECQPSFVDEMEGGLVQHWVEGHLRAKGGRVRERGGTAGDRRLEGACMLMNCDGILGNTAKCIQLNQQQCKPLRILQIKKREREKCNSTRFPCMR